MIFDETNPFFTNIKSTVTVSNAEATIAWFYSGRKQPIIKNEIRSPVYSDGEFDCTDVLQRHIHFGCVFVPVGIFRFKEIKIDE